MKNFVHSYKSVLGGVAVYVVLLTGALEVSAAAENAKIEAKLKELPQPVEVIDSSPEAWRLKHGNEMEIVAVEGMPFDNALRITSREKVRDKDYLVQAVSDNIVPVDEGDVMLATFYARVINTMDESGEGTVSFFFRPNTPPWGVGSKKKEAGFGPEWKKFYHPFVAGLHRQDAHDEAGEMEGAFNIGHHIQTVELADIHVYKYPKGVAYDDLPGTVETYEGRELDAPWRVAANERIEKYRKADLEVIVTDENGKPLPGAPVSVEMQEHAFPFASAINGVYMEKTFDRKGGEKYRKEFAKLFNKTVHIGDMKWPQWEQDRQLVIDNVNWLEANDIEVRGHCLVWPRFDKTPWGDDKEAQKYFRKNPDKLQEKIIEHIEDVVGTMKGKVTEYDVYNEPNSHYEFVDMIGEQAIVEWFEAAHKADPDAVLYLNEGGKVSRPNVKSDSHRYFQSRIKLLQDAGAPIGGVGFESHFRWGCPHPEEVYEVIDYYWNEFGLPIQVTEFDHRVSDLQLQADWQRDFMTICFSHPAMVGFIQWGFWNGISQGGFIDDNWKLLPNGEQFMDLVFNKWWTEESGQTNAEGKFDVRGFMGEYEVAVEHKGQTWKFPVTLGKDGAVLHAQLTDDMRKQLNKQKSEEKQAKKAAIAAAEEQIQQSIERKKSGIVAIPQLTSGKARINVGGRKSNIPLTPGPAQGGGELSNATWLSPEENDKILIFQQSLGPDNWEQLSFTFTPQEDGVVPVSISSEFTKGHENQVWVLYDGVEISGSDLQNGDFESGDKQGPTEWQLKKSKTPARYITVDGVAHSGDKCLLVSFSGNASQDIPVKKGQPVTISAWAKLPNS